MNAVLEHLQEHLVLYIVLFVGLTSIIYATRRYSIPIIQYTLEVLIYCGIMHVVVWAVTYCAAAFKRASSFKALASDRALEATWSTPLVRFWDLDLYDPSWLATLEILAIVGIIILVWRLRPMKIQKSTKATIAPARRGAGQGMRPSRTLGRVGGRRK